MLDDLTILHQLTKNTINEKFTLFKPKDSYRMQGGSRDTSLTTGTNLPNGVIVHYNVKDFDKAKDTVQLHFKDSEGILIKTFSTFSNENPLKVKKGGNTFVWNTRYKGAERLKDMIFWSASFSGAKALPGNYSVSIEKNKLVKEQVFTVLPDPRSEVTVSEMKKQFDFVNKINETVDKAHQGIKNIRIINHKLETFESTYGDLEKTKAIIEKVKSLKELFSTIEKALYQTQNKSNQDPLNFPIRLTNKLGHLNRLVTTNDFPPTDQDEAVRIFLTKEVEKLLLQYSKLVEEDLEIFNKMFAALKLDYLTLK
tara:strand:- start:791 stop:1723 length:933 start_codon:yes stop_codon:yes gene_type:complete